MDKADQIAACSQLRAVGLGDRIIFSDSRYRDLVAPHWSLTAELTPYCVIQPETTKEVAKVVSVLSQAEGCLFAVRSGGHTQWPGASNCSGGIVIDLCRMKNVEYDEDRNIVIAQAGCRWRDVYSKADEYGVTVNGGRMGDVGVGGFLCGGGISWLLPRYGFGCDMVVNYEVVLANGDIIHANHLENADLFLALKGGACNFGIVTRFYLEAIKGAEVWAGMYICQSSTSTQHIKHFVDYIDTIEEKTDTSYCLLWAWSSEAKDVVLSVMVCNTLGVVEPQALSGVMEVPWTSKTVDRRSVTALALHLESPQPFYNKWLTATFANDGQILTKIVEFHEKLIEKLKVRIPENDFSTVCCVQALPKLYAERSLKRGGNVMGVERLGENCFILLLGAHIKVYKDMEYGFRALQECYEDIVKDAKSNGVFKEWLYLNYSDMSQNPLPTFGEDNVEKIRAAALKYDPNGIFQSRCPGGFKISKIPGKDCKET
ncbi:uncharacterized protein CTRU02_215534 [Colletotrichum truncatum]|uniref:Uncharacterized protein n=1 Tax=Colletotrichum truncatum TaxID=5467 RepID=A0ACC3YCU0_COLTU|nr:uncharacterized protein CTRU02_05521 [Colletotrichum truncatum]KAF6793964.1 hypothetical protein CTRU02_05521 [Colletotrichum truncatum]